ncbi:MAG: hypothetical protein ABI323_01880 [Solirubrobacteraceae bacterium]
MNRLTLVRAARGVALLFTPGRVLSALPHQQIDPPARAFARVLGARDLVFLRRNETRLEDVAGVACLADELA